MLAETTSDIVTKMKPAVICCCEVGTAASPMTREQVEAMVDAMRNAWEEAATKHPAISFLFEDDAPYLTIWDDNRCKCTHGRILKNVYHVPGHRRTAQAFLCTMPGVAMRKASTSLTYMPRPVPQSSPTHNDSSSYRTCYRAVP